MPLHCFLPRTSGILPWLPSRPADQQESTDLCVVACAADQETVDQRCRGSSSGCATLLTAAGVAPGVVMEILGRSQIAVTMNVYTHVVQDTQREAVSHMDRLLRRRPGRE